MKKILLLFIFLSSFFGRAQQYTLIPDANFEQALIYKGFDSGAIDGKVLTANVSGVTHLDVFSINITDLTGIQDFISLTSLECSNNNLTSLDVSKNIALLSLRCHGNHLTSLDVSKNTSLTELDCIDNKLTNLDVSKNIDLINLECWLNQLTNLNLKNGNNTKLLNINLFNNPLLSCIQVDNATYSNSNWSSKKDATASYSENCSKTAVTTSPPTITATGNQTYCPGTSLNIVETVNISPDPLDPDPNTDAVYIQISSGYVLGHDQLILAGSHPLITANWNSNEGKLVLTSASGNKIPYADFESAIKDVQFTNSNTSPSGIRTFSISLGTGDVSYLPSNGHYYEFVSALNIYWTAARAAAETRSYYGLEGYLATLTAADEAQLAGAQAPGTGWIGGSDAETEGVWKWVTGPEAGTVFWNGLNNGSSPNYANWNSPREPNNSGDEDYAHITSAEVGNPGTWNDLPDAGRPNTSAYQPKGYIVEYGGMSGETSLQLSASTKITISHITSTTAASRCDNGSVTLAADTPSGNIDWYNLPTGGTSLATGNTFTTPNLTTTTDYYAQADGCEATRVKVTATINIIPTLTITETTVALCGTGKTTLNATTDVGIINWYASSSDTTILGSGTAFTTPTTSQNTTFYAEAINNGCSNGNRIPVNIIVYSLPNVTDEEIAFCQGSSIELDAQLTGMQYVWSTGAATQKITVTTEGTYTVDVTNTDKCTSRKTIIVSKHILPEINYVDVNETTVVIYLKKETIYFEYSIDGRNYQSSNLFFDAPGGLQTAYVREINSCGIDTKNFIVLIAPKFFTPNNDSFNDRFEINGLEFYPKASVTIFDRYGKLLSILNAKNTSWDGTYNKVMLPASDYWYVLKIDDSATEKRGHFSLKR